MDYNWFSLFVVLTVKGTFYLESFLWRSRLFKFIYDVVPKVPFRHYLPARDEAIVLDWMPRLDRLWHHYIEPNFLSEKRTEWVRIVPGCHDKHVRVFVILLDNYDAVFSPLEHQVYVLVVYKEP